MRKLSKDGFLVFRGSCLPDGTVSLQPVDLIPTAESPYYGNRVFKEIKFVGTAKDCSILFTRHPYELIPTELLPEEVVTRSFALAVEHMPQLNRVEIFYRDTLVETLDRRKDAVVKLKTKVSPKVKGVVLTIQGAYSRLTITARDPRSNNWTHIYLDDTPTEGTTQTIEIPWDHFPVAERAVIEAVAIRGIHVTKYHTDEIEVAIQPVKPVLFLAGFRELKKENAPMYELVFAAKGYLHGRSIPASAYQWHILGKTYRGQYVTILRKVKRKFKVKITVTDQLRRKVSSDMMVDPAKLSSEFKQLSSKS